DPHWNVRAALATVLGTLTTDVAVPRLEAMLADTDQRVIPAVLGSLVKLKAPKAAETLIDRLKADDAMVRTAAATGLGTLKPANGYIAPRLTGPTVSTQVYLETDRGTIQIELAVLDAPLTVENFVALARKGYFDGLSVHRVVPNFVVQDGDPRGDGEGAPGYSIRDELSERPYLRGTVGMALDWADTGGSQYFISHSP